MPEKIYDVIIIGGGPAGLSAAQYAARVNLKTLVLDKSATASAIAYSSKIENYPGLTEPVSGVQLLDIFRNQAMQFGAEYAEEQVAGVNLEPEIKEVMTLNGTYKGRAVIIATGSMGRKPTIPGEEALLGKGVSYCAICDGAFFTDQTVSVIGDSEEAVKEAGVLTRFAEKVYLITPIKALTVSADHPSLASEKVHVMTSHRVLSIEGPDVVTKIRVKNTAKGSEHEMPMAGVFVYLVGSQPVVDFLGASIDLSSTACISTHRTMETTLPGVFAAGDVTCSAVRQVVIAAADGCIAALSAEKYIHHRTRSRADWSKS
jgi:thioredoxin reductase (NADPH)